MAFITHWSKHFIVYVVVLRKFQNLVQKKTKTLNILLWPNKIAIDYEKAKQKYCNEDWIVFKNGFITN